METRLCDAEDVQQAPQGSASVSAAGACWVSPGVLPPKALGFPQLQDFVARVRGSGLSATPKSVVICRRKLLAVVSLPELRLETNLRAHKCANDLYQASSAVC